MPSEFEIAGSQDRRVSLTNVRRLDSTGQSLSGQQNPSKIQIQAIPAAPGNPATVLEITKSFIDPTLREVEIHGWKAFTSSRTRAGRIFWVIILILTSIILIREVVMVVSRYYQNPLTVSYSVIINESMVFPNIYICPFSGINWTAIDQNKDLIPYALYLTNVFGLTGFDGQSAVGSFNHTILDVKEKMMQLGYDGDEFMPACSFSQSSSNYLRCNEIRKEIMQPKYGKCFVLSLHTDENRTQTVPGRGLSMTFNLHKELYPTLPFFMPTVEGVQLTVGDQITYLRPGSSYYIELRAEHLQFINLKRGNFNIRCVGNGENEFHYEVLNISEKSYSQPHCLSDCYIRELWNVCKCLPLHDPSQFKPEILYGSTPPFVCDAHRTVACVRPRIDNDPIVLKRVEQCRKRCYNPCDFTRYYMKVSDARLHAPAYEENVDNLIDVWMAYPSLDYAEFQQDVSKTADDVVSDLGGQIGLWLGASMVTIIQVPLLLTAICCCSSIRKGKKAKEIIVKRIGRAQNLLDMRQV